MDWWPSVHSGLLHQPNLNHSPPISLPSSLFVSLPLSLPHWPWQGVEQLVHYISDTAWYSTLFIFLSNHPSFLFSAPSIYPICMMRIAWSWSDDARIYPLSGVVPPWCSLTEQFICVWQAFSLCFYQVILHRPHSDNNSHHLPSYILHPPPPPMVSLSRAFSLFSPRATPPLPLQVWLCINHLSIFYFVVI